MVDAMDNQQFLIGTKEKADEEKIPPAASMPPRQKSNVAKAGVYVQPASCHVGESKSLNAFFIAIFVRHIPHPALAATCKHDLANGIFPATGIDLSLITRYIEEKGRRFRISSADSLDLV